MDKLFGKKLTGVVIADNGFATKMYDLITLFGDRSKNKYAYFV